MYKAIFIASSACALLLVGWITGRNSVQARWDTQIALDKAKVVEVVAAQDRVTERVITEYVDRIKVVQVAGQTITKRIPEYVKTDDCPMPSGFRLLHDAAATGAAIPESAPSVDAAPVAALDVARTVIDNYSTCHANTEQLAALQDWVSSQRQTTNEGASHD